MVHLSLLYLARSSRAFVATIKTSPPPATQSSTSAGVSQGMKHLGADLENLQKHLERQRIRCLVLEVLFVHSNSDSEKDLDYVLFRSEPEPECVVYWYSIQQPLHRSGYASQQRDDAITLRPWRPS